MFVLLLMLLMQVVTCWKRGVEGGGAGGREVEGGRGGGERRARRSRRGEGLEELHLEARGGKKQYRNATSPVLCFLRKIKSEEKKKRNRRKRGLRQMDVISRKPPVRFGVGRGGQGGTSF
jgi:hypothetical protein